MRIHKAFKAPNAQLCPQGLSSTPLPSAGISHCHGTPSLLHRLFPITFHKKIHAGLSLSSHIYLGWEVCL